jgi:hypothetical protein
MWPRHGFFWHGAIAASARGLALAVLSMAVAAPAGALEDFDSLILSQFEIYDPDYRIHYERYGERLEAMSQAIAAAEADGRSLHCSQQMYLEAKWLHRYTAHWERLEDKLTRIEHSLEDHDQAFAAEQSPVDGHWGVCYEEWFMRLGATLSGLESLAARGEEPRYVLRSTGRMDTGKKLLSRLQDLLISDIAHAGVDNRAELASLITTFAQGAFKPQLRELLVESTDLRVSSNLDSLTEAFRFFLSGAQDPTSGYWGAWYIVEGKTHKSRDLSMTYHIIAYTKGRVEHWPQIVETTRAIESEPYPYGWRHNGRYNNHNLYDVAKIYKFGWPFMSEAERREVAAQIQAMIDWSLANTLQDDGSFRHDPTFSDSLADEYYFAVSFFDVVGYWQAGKRFWSEAPPDENALAMCCTVKRRLEALDLEGWAAEGAMRRLESNCGRCAGSGD